jgi:hypothetical protein
VARNTAFADAELISDQVERDVDDHVLLAGHRPLAPGTSDCRKPLQAHAIRFAPNGIHIWLHSPRARVRPPCRGLASVPLSSRSASVIPRWGRRRACAHRPTSSHGGVSGATVRAPETDRRGPMTGPGPQMPRAPGGFHLVVDHR